MRLLKRLSHPLFLKSKASKAKRQKQSKDRDLFLHLPNALCFVGRTNCIASVACNFKPNLSQRAAELNYCFTDLVAVRQTVLHGPIGQGLPLGPRTNAPLPSRNDQGCSGKFSAPSRYSTLNWADYASSVPSWHRKRPLACKETTRPARPPGLRFFKENGELAQASSDGP